MSSTRRTDTPARYISIRSSSTLFSRQRYRSMIAVSKEFKLRHVQCDVSRSRSEMAAVVAAAVTSALLVALIPGSLCQFLGHGLLSPFRMACRNFILPENCKPCLFLSFFNLRNLLYLILFLSPDINLTAAKNMNYNTKCPASVSEAGHFPVFLYLIYLKYATPAAKMGWSLLPLMFSKMSSALNRSVWAILPRTRPSGLVMPSTARTDWFGLYSLS